MRDAQPNLRSRNRLAAHQPAVADACSAGKFYPLAVPPLVEREALDALAERQIFAQADDIERHLAAKIENQFGRLYLIVARPVGFAFAVKSRCAAKSALVVFAAHVAGADFCALRQVFGKCRVEKAAEFAQRLHVRVRESCPRRSGGRLSSNDAPRPTEE